MAEFIVSNEDDNVWRESKEVIICLKVLSWHLHGGAMANHKERILRTTDNLDQIWCGHLQNPSHLVETK